jgi:NADPH2:quinone reductase
MKAIEVKQVGGPEVLEYTDRAKPSPAAGQVLVHVAAIGLNFIEAYFRKGQYKAVLPFVPGSELSGKVVALGEGVTGFAVGDKVATVAALGSYAEYALVPAAALIKIPGGLDLKQAAAALLQGMTAHYLVNSTYVLKAGDTALIHAGAGGVGLLLTQLAKQKGARVIATVSTEAKAALSQEAGADAVILYTQKDFAVEAKKFTEGKGVEVVYDSVGKDTFDGSLSLLKPRGMMVLFGGSSGAVAPFDPIRLSVGGSLYITRPTLGHYTATRAELEWRAGEILDAVANGSLKLRIGAEYALKDAARAHLDLEGRKTTGKVLLIP